jgi:YHS domain-containing protein
MKQMTFSGIPVVMFLLVTVNSFAGTEAEKTNESELKLQTTCPVMGGEINRDLYVDHEGKRIYVCCEGCIDQVKNNPEKYIDKLESMGQRPEVILKPQTTCPVMGGEINKEIYADHDSSRVYFCCPQCVGEFKNNPQKYIDMLRENGQRPERL